MVHKVRRFFPPPPVRPRDTVRFARTGVNEKSMPGNLSRVNLEGKNTLFRDFALSTDVESRGIGSVGGVPSTPLTDACLVWTSG